MVNLKREKSYSDGLRKYKIYIDDVYVSEISAGTSLNLNVPRGKHKIYLKIDWCSSNVLDINCLDEEAINLECGNALKGYKKLFTLLYISFLRKDYLWIKEVGNDII